MGLLDGYLQAASRQVFFILNLKALLTTSSSTTQSSTPLRAVADFQPQLNEGKYLAGLMTLDVADSLTFPPNVCLSARSLACYVIR